MKARPFLSAVIACLCGFAVQTSAGEEPVLSEAKRNRMDVDLIFVNGNVYTVNERQLHAEAVAVKNERIAFVGSNDEAKKFHVCFISLSAVRTSSLSSRAKSRRLLLS